MKLITGGKTKGSLKSVLIKLMSGYKRRTTNLPTTKRSPLVVRRINISYKTTTSKIPPANKRHLSTYSKTFKPKQNKYDSMITELEYALTDSNKNLELNAKQHFTQHPSDRKNKRKMRLFEGCRYTRAKSDLEFELIDLSAKPRCKLLAFKAKYQKDRIRARQALRRALLLKEETDETRAARTSQANIQSMAESVTKINKIDSIGDVRYYSTKPGIRIE